MQHCVIIAGRPVSAAMRRYIPRGAYIIAADAGWRTALELGVPPDIVIGDFDSSPQPVGLPVLATQPEKDDTDTGLAVRYALEKGAESITILGVLGGRMDHSFANLQTLCGIARHNIPCLLADEDTEIRILLPGELILPRQQGRYLSVFAYGGAARGVVLEGVKYPLQNATLTPEYPIGVSNEWVADTAYIRHTEGLLLVMAVRQDGPCSK